MLGLPLAVAILVALFDCSGAFAWRASFASMPISFFYTSDSSKSS